MEIEKSNTLLGSGGFGFIYKGLLKSSNEAIAIKQVKCKRPIFKKWILNEILVLNGLNHENVIKFYGFY